MMEDGKVTDVRIQRMKAMGPNGDRGWVVQVKLDGRWVAVLDDGTRGQAERVAAEARSRVRAS